MNLSKIKNSSHFSILVTFISQSIVLLLNIFLLRVLSNRLSEEGFGVVLLIKRFVNLAFPVFILNLHISLSKYISANMTKRFVYLFWSLLLSISIYAIIIIPSYFFKDRISFLFFNDESLSNLIIPLIFFLFATGIQFLTFGFYRGKHEFIKMNIISISFWIIQICIVYFINFGTSYSIAIERYFYIVSLISAVIYLSIPLFDYLSVKKSLVPTVGGTRIKEFITYGVSRTPSGFIIAFIYFVPIYFATKTISLTAAAYIGIIITITRMVQKFGEPFSIIFLPKFSHYKSQNNNEQINHKAKQIIEFVFTFPLLFGSFIYLLAPEMIQIWFGERYLTIVDYLKLITPFIGFSLAYLLLRGILDGLYDFPYLNIITFLGLAVLAVGFSVNYIFNLGVSGIVFSLGLAMLTLSLSSILILGQKLKLKFNKRNIFVSILWSIIVFGSFIFISPLIQFGILINILIKCILSLVIVIVSFFIYRYLKIAKFHELKLRLK